MKRLDQMERTELYERIRKAERERDELASYYCVKDMNVLRAKHWREAADCIERLAENKSERDAALYLRGAAEAIEIGGVRHDA